MWWPLRRARLPLLRGYYSHVGTVNLGLAVNPVSGDLFVANTDALNLTFFQPNLRGHWVNNRITRIQVASGQVTPFDLNPGINYSILPNPQALSTALAQPTNVVFDPSGNFMYVAAFGTDRVAQVDTNGNVLWFVEVAPPSGSGSNVDPAHKRGPQGTGSECRRSDVVLFKPDCQLDFDYQYLHQDGNQPDRGGDRSHAAGHQERTRISV